jgi:hypothetical protein
MAGATISLSNGVLSVASRFAGDTLVLNDPDTGGRLLAGTVLGDDPGVPVPHASAEFTLLSSFAGVVLVANSDRLALRAGKAGFSLAMAEGPKLAAVAGGSTERDWGAAADLTRHFGFVPLPTPTLLRSLRTAVGTAARAPLLARLPARLVVAQDMVGLGMTREAAGTLQAALRDDPAAGSQPDAPALLAMAHFLSRDALDDESRAADAAAMANSALGHSDEIALWRAIMAAKPGGAITSGMQDGVAQRAATLGANWRLLLAYPTPLQYRLAPLVAQALLAGGQGGAARTLTDNVPDHALDGVRAALLAQAGQINPALALLDRIGNGADRRLAAQAYRDAVELRLANHLLSPAQAAEALDRHLYAWRDDESDIAQRLRVGALRAQSGAWRRALQGLRVADQLYPTAHERVLAAELSVIGGLLQAGQAQRLAAVDLVTLVDESSDLLGAAQASATLAPVLADKLVALDLPDRAAPILDKLMQATAAPAPRAALGARLASLRLDQKQPGAAIDALQRSASANLPDDMQSARGVLRARALADSGQADTAITELRRYASADALDLQARLLEARNDWQGAEMALQALAHLTMPPAGVLSDVQQDSVLHLASVAARAGDMAVLQQLQAGDARRLTSGNRAALFQALSQPPIQTLADLPRSAREAVAARAIPAALAGYRVR